jgi:hypothetical protein
MWSSRTDRRLTERRPRISGYYGPVQDSDSMLDGRADEIKRDPLVIRRTPMFPSQRRSGW